MYKTSSPGYQVNIEKIAETINIDQNEYFCRDSMINVSNT